MNALGLAANTALLIAAVHGGWWALSSLLALPRPKEGLLGGHSQRLVVVVPAHNEELLIADCVRSLKAARTGRQREILVVADNCTDSTASIARSLGATVLERTDPAHLGKSFALDFAIRELASRRELPDAVLFVDADSVVSPSFFEAIEGRLNAGASAVQVHYAAAPGTSALGRLRQIALLLIHWSRPLGASRLRLGSSLKGNGMALSWAVVSEGTGGHGLAEDAAMTLSLARRGVAVAFEPRATVTGFMAQDYATARTQDERWERGRLGLLPSSMQAAAIAIVRGHFAAAAGALETASLPLSVVVALTMAGGLGSVFGQGSAVLAAVATGLVCAYLVVGTLAARVRLRDLVAILAVPRYLFHKGGVYLSVVTRHGHGWQRTQRAGD